MKLFGEIFKDVDGVSTARYTVVIGGGGYFEGVKAVEDFSTEKVVLIYPKTGVEISGTALCIKKYCDGDLELLGEIVSLRFSQERKKEK